MNEPIPPDERPDPGRDDDPIAAKRRARQERRKAKGASGDRLRSLARDEDPVGGGSGDGPDISPQALLARFSLPPEPVVSRSWVRRLLPLALTVVIPVTIAAVHLFLFASDRFETTFRLTVRQAHGPSTASTFDLGLLGGQSQRTEDLEQLVSFFTSTDLAVTLDERADLRDHYQDLRIDRISRLGGDATREDYVTYLQGRMSATVDALSGTIGVRIESFDPAKGPEVAQVMIAEAVTFINRLGNAPLEARQEFLASELKAAEEKLSAAMHKTLAFQRLHNLPDPLTRAAAQNARISELEAALTREQTHLRELRSYLSGTAPEVRAADARVAAVLAQIGQEKDSALNRDRDSLGEVLVAYHGLTVAQEFALERYRALLAATEAARAELSQQAKHVVLLEVPLAPERPTLPRRWYWLVTVVAFSLAIQGIGRMLLLSIRERRNS